MDGTDRSFSRWAALLDMLASATDLRSVLPEIASALDEGMGSAIFLLGEGDFPEEPYIDVLPRQIEPSLRKLAPAAWLEPGETLARQLSVPPSLAAVMAPLISQGECLGVLVGYRTPSKRVDRSTLSLAAQLALHAAQALRVHRTEQERRHLQTLIENLPSAVALVDNHGRRLICNRPTCEIWCKPTLPSATGDGTAWIGFHPDGRPLTEADWPLARSLRKGEVVDGEEILVQRWDGTRGILRIHAAPVRADDGSIQAGVVTYDDVTDHHLARATVHASVDQLRMIADALPALVSLVGRDRRYRYANRRYTDWRGLKPEDVVGMTIDELLGPQGAEASRPHFDLALAGQQVSYEAEFDMGSGSSRLLSMDYIPCRSPDGSVDSVVVLGRDVTEARRAEDRIAFLAEASRILSSSLDVDATLQGLAEAAVPRLADWCVIHVLDDGGTLRLNTVHHSDPELAARGRWVRERWPDHLGLGRVLQTGQPVLIEVDEEGIRKIAADEEHAQVLLSFGTRSIVAVPIPTARGLLGVLLLATAESNRTFVPADLTLAVELAARVGLALDNARLLREARESDRAKEEFIAMLAHELRNPLAPILNGIEMLQAIDLSGLADPQTPELAVLGRTLGVIERQTLKLARLVDDLLDISRISRGQITLHRERCSLAAILRHAAETTRLIEARGHRLIVEVPPGIGLMADPVRMEQVFSNLLHNAAKYTEPGGTIRIVARRKGDRVEIQVSDTGIGIAPEVLPQVFMAFRQGAVDLDRSHGGLGLGLTLVERLVALHQGTVSAHSDGPGKGSTFTVVLPVLAGELPPAEGSSLCSQGESRAPQGPLRILVVDDNVDAAVAVAELLRVLGHTVELAYDGPTALKLAADMDVVVLDLGLPGMDGFAVARALRAAGHPLRIVALSGYGRDQDRRESQLAGCDQHLVKPADTATLLRAIQDR